MLRLDLPPPRPSLPPAEEDAWFAFLQQARLRQEGLVGRQAELVAAKAWYRGRDTRVPGTATIGWIGGRPGVGKSLLMARLAADAANGKPLVYYHAFRGGDPRNNRRAFLRGLQGALVRWDALAGRTVEPSAIAREGKELEDDVRRRLAAIEGLAAAPGEGYRPRLLVFLDGLDEVVRHDQSLPALIRELALPGTVWVLAGRPDYGLSGEFGGPGCEHVFGGQGLPGMRPEDIRAMLLEGLGHARHALLRLDEDERDTVRNFFFDRVVERADGLPLYVHLLLEDLRDGDFVLPRMATDEDRLPRNLQAYYRKALEGPGISSVRSHATLLVCVLARAEEPLDEAALGMLLAKAGEIEPAGGEEAARRATELCRSLLRPACQSARKRDPRSASNGDPVRDVSLFG
jgi:hypothetical protein